MHFILKTSLCLLLPFSGWAQHYTISTIAGTGAAGSTGDAGPATSAELSGPVGLATTGGKLYIADPGNEKVRLVSAGKLTTVVGDGGIGYLGDGGAAIHAQLNAPASVVVDSQGNLYVADGGNDVIRMVAPDGTISTVAGVVCTLTITTNCGPGFGGDGGLATSALLNNPLGLAVDPYGNLYIADSNNNVIRKVSGGKISTVGSTLRFSHPAGIALDAYQNLYVADTSNNRIVMLKPSGAATIVAGNSQPGYSGDGGLATQAQLQFPADVALDAAGDLFIVDRTNDVIREVNTQGIITTIAGNSQPGYSGDGGNALDAQLNFPGGIAVDTLGEIYISDTGNNVIRLLKPPAPAIATSGVVNAASYATSVSPGSLASIFGSYFGAAVAGATKLPFPTALNNVSVSVNGKLAPVFYVGPSQINFQIPWTTATGNATVSVSVNSVTSNSGSVTVLPASPGLFLQNSGAAIVQNSDYSLNQGSNPAAAGSAIIAYLTGSGPVSQSVPDGAASPTPAANATSKVTATIGTQTADVLFAGLAPGLVGVLQVNITVPAGMAPGSYPLTVTVGGKASNSAPISVK